MIQKEFCQDCHQKHNCQEVSRQLNDATCPSVTCKVIVAFLLPLLIFIASLAAFDKLFISMEAELLQLFQFATPAKIQGLQTVISFLMALLITSVFIFVTGVITKKLHRNF